MAIAPTGAAYKSLTFDNKTSREFGVYITGEAVYNAPEREVEMISIPGRNGSFALDKGRFENIDVKYPAGLFGDNEANFREALSDFRNFLCSKRGYCRLTDDYNPNEFRKAVYKSGLEVENVRNIAGEFDILFDCMPQRWLTSGETKQTIANSGDTINNPTLFESSPLLEIEGYGQVNFNNTDYFSVTGGPLGEYTVCENHSMRKDLPTSGPVDIDSYFNVGDVVHIGKAKCTAISTNGHPYIFSNISNISGGEDTQIFFTGNTLMITTTFDYGDITVGTDVAQISRKIEFDAEITTGEINRLQLVSILKYDSGALSWYAVLIGPATSGVHEYSWSNNTWQYAGLVLKSVSGYSTKDINSLTKYIDMDTGECYVMIGGKEASANGAVSLMPELPTLKSGVNTISYTNTITSLKITPGWWKV